MWSLRLPIKVACTGNAGTRVARGNTFTVSSAARPFSLVGPERRRHRTARLRFARRLRRRAPRRLRRSSSTPARALADSQAAARPSPPRAASSPFPSSSPRTTRQQSAARVGDHADDGDATAGDAGDGYVGDDGADDVGDDRADYGHGCGSPYDKAGRAASRPGFPLQSPLRSDFRCNPSRLRSRPLTARSACRTTGHAVPTIRTPRRTSASFSSRRPCAQRSSQTSPRSPWPATPAAGIASAGRRCTPCLAGAGFAAHRTAHRARYWCPHRCGHSCGRCRRRLRQRAAHGCLRLRPPRPPLNRRGGSPPPASPASIPRTLMQQAWPSRTAGAALGLTPHASVMHFPPASALA